MNKCFISIADLSIDQVTIFFTLFLIFFLAFILPDLRCFLYLYLYSTFYLFYRSMVVLLLYLHFSTGDVFFMGDSWTQLIWSLNMELLKFLGDYLHVQFLLAVFYSVTINRMGDNILSLGNSGLFFMLVLILLIKTCSFQ